MAGLIYLWLSDGIAWARVVGSAERHSSTLLRDFVRNAFNVGIFQRAVDLAECTELDSTFMGTIAYMGIVCFERKIAPPRILNCSTPNKNAFENLGLDQLLNINPPPPRVKGPIQAKSQVTGLKKKRADREVRPLC